MYNKRDCILIIDMDTLFKDGFPGIGNQDRIVGAHPDLKFLSSSFIKSNNMYFIFIVDNLRQFVKTKFLIKNQILFYDVEIELYSRKDKIFEKTYLMIPKENIIIENCVLYYPKYIPIDELYLIKNMYNTCHFTETEW